MKLLTLILALIVNAGQAFLTPLQVRDSVLIADQLEYGFTLDSLRSGTPVALPDFGQISSDTLTLVRGWQLDTLRATDGKLPGRSLLKSIRSGKSLFRLKASVVLAPFEEGTYHLPDIPVGILRGELPDTLVFEGVEVEVKSMPVDTSTFEIRDIKGQIRYPVTAAEVLPWVGIGLAAAALVAALVFFLMRRRKAAIEAQRRDPDYIIALRELEKYRGDKYWAPERQKQFYSGITDALKTYIDSRFGIDAPEMTTAELFAALKTDKDITPELFASLKDLFERADFIKFAKAVASDTENAEALPLAVRFVTTTYQQDLEAENSGQEAAAK